MTDLTEKWKKGELPCGWYWVESSISEGIYAYTAENLNNMYRPRNGEKVLAPVPSYDEWQASENYIDYLKQCISVYESKDKQATETSIAYNELVKKNEELKDIKKATAKAQIRSCDLEIINQQLKELLKECRRQFEEVELYRYDVADTDQEDWLKISTEQASIANKMIAKIDEVLK